jgi:hypothetical protein
MQLVSPHVRASIGERSSEVCPCEDEDGVNRRERRGRPPVMKSPPGVRRAGAAIVGPNFRAGVDRERKGHAPGQVS